MASLVRRIVLMGAALLGAGAPGLAAQPPATLALLPDERRSVLDANTEASSAQAQSGLGGGASPDRQVHGEIEAMVGTNGARGVRGAAAIPLGRDAGMAVEFEDSRFGRWR